MRKSWVVLMAVFALVAFAVPAMAEVNVNGMFRIKPYVSNYEFGYGFLSPTKKSATKPTFAYVDERARLKFTVGDENVKGVAFFEFDQIWGDSAYTNGRNLGGALEADTNNLETKNLFVWFKVPNTSVDVTVGVQNQSDSYAGIFMGGADLAGIFANAKVDPVAIRFGYSKLWENSELKADDIDLWVAEAKFNPTKDVKLGVNLYFLNDMSAGVKGPTTAGATADATKAFFDVDGNGKFDPAIDILLSDAFGAPVLGITTTAGFNGRGAFVTTTPAELSGAYDTMRLYMPGIDFSAAAGPVKLTGFLLYQFGKAKPVVGEDVKVKGLAVDLRGELNVAATGGNAFIEALYVTGDDNKTDKDYKSLVTLGNYNLSGAFYTRTDMNILFPNIDDLQFGNKALAYDVSNGGAGVIHVGAGYSQKLTDKLDAKIGLGYLKAAKKRAHDIVTGYSFAEKTTMGTEVNARVNYALYKGLDLGISGAMAFLGDAYKDPTTGDKARNPYETHARLNYAF